MKDEGAEETLIRTPTGTSTGEFIQHCSDHVSRLGTMVSE